MVVGAPLGIIFLGLDFTRIAQRRIGCPCNTASSLSLACDTTEYSLVVSSGPAPARDSRPQKSRPDIQELSKVFGVDLMASSLQHKGLMVHGIARTGVSLCYNLLKHCLSHSIINEPGKAVSGAGFPLTINQKYHVQ